MRGCYLSAKSFHETSNSRILRRTPAEYPQEAEASCLEVFCSFFHLYHSHSRELLHVIAYFPFSLFVLECCRYYH